jgi:hypothetical protein
MSPFSELKSVLSSLWLCEIICPVHLRMIFPDGELDFAAIDGRRTAGFFLCAFGFGTPLTGSILILYLCQGVELVFYVLCVSKLEHCVPND